MNSSPFILPRAGAKAAPPGFPPDVAPNQIIAAAHINAIRDSVAIWPGNVDGGGFTLSNAVLSAAMRGAAQTPWLQNIDGGAFALLNVATLDVNGAARFGAFLGGTSGSVDVTRPTGQDNYIRVHAGNVYNSRFGFDTSNYLYAFTDDAPRMVLGAYNGDVQIWAGPSPRFTISAAGAIAMGNGAADAVSVSGRLAVTGNNDNLLIPLKYSGASVAKYLGADSSGVFHIYHSGGSSILSLDDGGVLALPLLPSANPGAGSKKLWYDPVDGNRVKYAA
jgi:hypothetical protein